MRKLVLLVIGLVFAFQMRVHADEGMWLLSLIGQVNMDEMTEMGLQLTAEQIYSINQASLKDAVGALDGGSCTAELVSPDGLLLTNHHCGYGEIQNHSSLEHDYLKNGFWAMTRDEELPNEGKTISFLVRMEEVSDRIAPELNEEMNFQARASKIRSLTETISAEATEGTHYEARVRSMFNGNRFFLFVTETYRDVRLVGAPPESIGKFGHDTDNWMWPRHTGDFSMFRIYTGPDGLPADYSPENIPLKSKHYLPISLKGYEKGDFTMVMGFPGSTSRYMTSWEIQESLEVDHPIRIQVRGIKLDLMMADMQADEKVRIQYASKHSRSSNYWKNSIGMSKGLKKLKVAEKKQELETAFTEWVNQNEERKALYGNALSDIQSAVEGRRELQIASSYIIEAYFYGFETVMAGRNLRQLEMVLADPEPDQEEVQRVAGALKESSARFFKDYNAPTDKKVMTAMVSLLIEELNDEYLPSSIQEVKTKYKGDAAKYVDNYFKKSFLTDQARYNAFMDNPSLKVLRKDPGYQAVLASQILYEIGGKMGQFEEAYDRGSRLFLKGLVEMYPDKDFYSDANSTMRMNYGVVGDYFPRDAVLYTHYTTLEGVMEKEDPNNFEFVVSERLKELYKAKDYGPYGVNGQMNVCFTSNNDITGGNSGSPVMNAHGELLGLAFDGNWEAMSGDVAFETKLQKCINVDIRYVLFVIDKYAGAGHLVKEMTLAD
ncbi:MAG: S46 family peptidase [Bacteroidia bacterium]|nr:MAG: S46 family peptidase [Bacteroidia bacterium]